MLPCDRTHGNVMDWRKMSALRGTRLVSFDAFNTLIRPRIPIPNVYAEFGRRNGLNVDPDQLSRSFRKHYNRMNDLHPAFAYYNADYIEAPQPIKSLKTPAERFWSTVVYSSFMDCLPATDDASTTTPDERDEIIVRVGSQLFQHYSGQEPWQLLDGVADTLQWLQRKGLVLIVVSNFDFRLKGILEALGVGQYFASVTMAGEVGFEKPDYEIYKIAFRANTGFKMSEILHVGDDVEKDYKTTQEMGCQSVLLCHNGNQDDIPKSGIPKNHLIHSIPQLREFVN